MSDNLNLTISEKFEKELLTFMLWISDSDYKISKTKGSEELNWSIDLLSSFEEPGRNKLECFIKELKKVYFISYNEQQINDIKAITKNFRENKSKISKNIKKNGIQVQKKEVKNLVKENVEENVEENVKENMKENVKENVEENVKENVKENMNMSDNVCKLGLTTEILVGVLGMPKYCKNEYVKYKWDLKCEKTDKSFMIYNWVNEDKSFEVFESTEWYLVEIGDDNRLIAVSYINFMNFFESQKEIETESFDIEVFGNIEVFNPVKNEIKQQEERKYLEGPSYENLEINLDDIEF